MQSFLNIITMNNLVYSMALVLGLLECAAKLSASNVNKLPITLYYEVLCSYCMEFVTRQLDPSMMRKERLAFTELTLVPYGNARRNKSGQIDCQHGVKECKMNAWHACVLETQNISNSLELIACMMQSEDNLLNQCGTILNIDVSSVMDCKKSRSNDQILQKYADLTDKVKHRGVPAIAIDNVYRKNEQNNIIDNFDKVFCDKYKKKFNKVLDNC